MTDGELKKRIVENIFDVNWQDGFYTDRDKNPVTEETVLQEILDSAKKDLIEYLIEPKESDYESGIPYVYVQYQDDVALYNKLKKWFGDSS